MEAEPERNTRDRLSRFRYLVDILVLIAASGLLQMATSAVFRPNNLQSELSFGIIAKVLTVFIAYFLIRLRGERLADIGLKTPEAWPRTILIGCAYAAIVFVIIYLSENAGLHRDLSAFREVQGNLGFTLFGIAFSFLGAGFYEEFMYRGFYFQGMAMLFGGKRAGWIGA